MDVSTARGMKESFLTASNLLLRGNLMSNAQGTAPIYFGCPKGDRVSSLSCSIFEVALSSTCQAKHRWYSSREDASSKAGYAGVRL